MARFRPLISFVLVLFSVLLVSCSSPAPKAFVYTPEQTAAIERYATDIQDMRGQMLSKLSVLIQDKDWVDIGTFIHGPLGEMRTKMSNLTRNLDPKLQAESQDVAKEVFGHLVSIDEAASEKNFDKAAFNYREALKDIDAFLQLAPVDSSLDAA